MFSDQERDIFIEYSLRSEETLAISINTALAFEHLRKKIIKTCVMGLAELLRKRLSDEWTIAEKSIVEDPLDRYSGITVSKKKWNNKHQIGISSEQYGAKDFIIGVREGSESFPHVAGLQEVMNREYRQGKQSSWWTWYQSVESPYRNWDNEEALVKMHRGEAVEYFAKHILRIADIASPLIDAHLEKTDMSNCKKDA